jgi:uncharacterized membrane protein YdjX (TVP38/TMEM64 family)
MNKNVLIRTLIVSMLLAAAFGVWKLNLTDYLTLDGIRAQQAALKAYQADYPLTVLGGFFFLYIAVAALSLPGAAIMTLLGGALFGLWPGLLTVSFASSIGATLAFLMARFLLKDWIQARYQKQLSTVNKGFEEEGSFYLFALRLIPVFPFFLVNTLTGVMPIKTRSFYAASQLGMLPGTAVYVYAGTALGKIQSLSDIASPSLLAAFVLLGLFPIVAKKIVAVLRGRRKA